MVQDAQKNQAADAKRKEIVDARNAGDQALYQAEKALKDLGEKVSGADRANAEGLMNDLRDALKTEDAARITRAGEALSAALQQIGQNAYGQGQPQPEGGQPQNGNGNGKNDEGVVEGEYRAV